MAMLLRTLTRGASRFGVGSRNAARFRPSASLGAPSNSQHLLIVHHENQRLFSSSVDTVEPLSLSNVEPLKEAVEPSEPLKEAVAVGAGEEFAFQAETKQLLDIVINSLYTDKDVFIRELISNSSDALEKARHHQVSGDALNDPAAALEIRITTDEKNNQLIIEDTGIGMTHDELTKNLGTIARSGSKEFVTNLKNENKGTDDAVTNLIGKFGVGFYSAFMAADKVSVFTCSALDTADSQPLCWESDGTGSYSIAQAEGVKRGTRVVMSLKEDSSRFSLTETVEGILKRYSNFVQYPIFLNGERVNTVNAIWAMDKNSVTDEQYTEFYRFISNTHDEPMQRLHFAMDAPLELKGVLFVGSLHQEKFGMARMSPGVNVYSRKVLLQSKSAEILPDWLRFVRGAVDSEDLPLSISREAMQDSALMRKLKDVLTRRLIRWFRDIAKRQPEEYLRFYREYNQFLKEGVCMEHAQAEEIAKLLRFESSTCPEGELTSLDEYISRMPQAQKNIYYLIAPDRKLLEQSPYYEDFKRNKIEVLFMHTAIDEFIMGNLSSFMGRQFKSGEAGNVDLASDGGFDADAELKSEATPALSPEVVGDLLGWMKDTLGDRVAEVTETTRLQDNPAIIVDHESAAVRRMMAYVDQTRGGGVAVNKQKLAVNPQHKIMQKLNSLRNSNPSLASNVAEQVFDNALLSAGLMDDARVMVPRLNNLLYLVMESEDDVRKE